MPTQSIVKKEASQSSSSDPSSAVRAAAADFTEARQSVIEEEASQPPSDDPSKAVLANVRSVTAATAGSFQEAHRDNDDAEAAEMPAGEGRAEAEMPTSTVEQEADHDNNDIEIRVDEKPSEMPAKEMPTDVGEDDPDEMPTAPDEEFDPDKVCAGALVVVLGSRGEPWQATIEGRRAKNGAPGFAIRYDGKSYRRRRPDWVPQESVVNYVVVDRVNEARGSGTNSGGRQASDGATATLAKTAAASDTLFSLTKDHNIPKHILSMMAKWKRFVSPPDPRPCFGCTWCGPVRRTSEGGIAAECREALCPACRVLEGRGWFLRDDKRAKKKIFIHRLRQVQHASVGEFLQESTRIVGKAVAKLSPERRTAMFAELHPAVGDKKRKRTPPGERKKGGSDHSDGGAKDAGPFTLDEQWERNFEALTKFRDKEGHCRVPYRNHEFKTLANWVRAQRTAYKRNGGTLPFNRAARLDRIGFAWKIRQSTEEEKEKTSEPTGGGRKKGREEGERKKEAGNNSGGMSKETGRMTLDERWEQRYRELVRYKARTGTVCISRSSKFKNLRIWVREQCGAYKRNKGVLIGDRVARLESIGFVWNPRVEQWERNFRELVEFKKAHDHCYVPTRDGRLGEWVKKQRARKGELSEERIARLDGLGFAWDGRRQHAALPCASDDEDATTQGARVGRSTAATGDATNDGRKVAASRAIAEDVKAEHRRELLCEVDWVLDNPSLGPRQIESFKQGVRDLARKTRVTDK